MAYLSSITTLVPPYKYSQCEILTLMKGLLRDDSSQRYLNQIYPSSGIEFRYSVIEDFDDFCARSSPGHKPNLQQSTKARNDLYHDESTKLVVSTVKNLFDSARHVRPEDISHIVTVSCTGFSNPGPDISLIEEGLLPHSVERYHLGFMGCYGAFPALKMATQFCNSHANATVLVVCVELCTLHMQLGTDIDSILSNSLFSDGCAAALITSKCPRNTPYFNLNRFDSTVLVDARSEMAWSIGNTGFELVLTKYVSRILGLRIKPVVDRLLETSKVNVADIASWLIHPGGKSILDRIEHALNLPEHALDLPRFVLRNYGNMSSVTILFVLQEALNKNDLQSKFIAMAFGPGLTIESALLSADS